MISSTPSRVRLVLSGVGTTLVLAAGCGSSAPPGQAVPELRSTLAQIDATIVDGEYAQAREQIDRLVRITVAARDDARLDAQQADGILAAAASLSSALPRSKPTAEPTVEASEPADSGDRGRKQGLEKKHEKGHGNGAGDGKGDED